MGGSQLEGSVGIATKIRSIVRFLTWTNMSTSGPHPQPSTRHRWPVMSIWPMLSILFSMLVAGPPISKRCKQEANGTLQRTVEECLIGSCKHAMGACMPRERQRSAHTCHALAEHPQITKQFAVRV